MYSEVIRVMGLFNPILLAIRKHAKKILRVNPGMSKMKAGIKAFLELETIPQRGNWPLGKIDQIRSLFSSAKYVNKGIRFVYSIDEKCIPLLKYKVIDNMPIDYQKVVDYSLNDLAEFNEALNGKISMQNLQTIDVIKEYIALFCKNEMEDRNKAYISRIVDCKAGDLEEALQRILFWNQMLWQTKHTLMGLGRLDKVLARFPLPENAEEIICDFLITLHSFYNFKSNNLMGDTGQIILLGGREQDGSYYCNPYTYLFLRCLKKLHLPDPKILLRATADMPEDLLDLAVDTIATGIGSPLLSNDDVIIPLLMDFGYSPEDAYGYGVSACWEPLAIGKSLEQNNIASIEFGAAAAWMIEDDAFQDCGTFEEVFALYSKYLNESIEAAFAKIDAIEWEYDPLLTMLTDGCLDNDRDISLGGAVYNDYGILSVGMSAAVDSLLNIKRLCLEEKVYSLGEIQECVRNNYSGFDKMHDALAEKQDGFGTDSEQAVALTNRILAMASEKVSGYRNRYGGKVKFGLSSPSYLEHGKKAGATADGRLVGMPFATHISRDKADALTQTVNFAASLTYRSEDANANVVDIMVPPHLLRSQEKKFVQFLRAAITSGVFQIQFNVVSSAELMDAKKHPENHRDLIVRVWGFSAYFNDLPVEYKDMLIARAQESERAS